jgi:hypothetical protein
MKDSGEINQIFTYLGYGVLTLARRCMRLLARVCTVCMQQHQSRGAIFNQIHDESMTMFAMESPKLLIIPAMVEI